jgi:hypothetical protein
VRALSGSCGENQFPTGKSEDGRKTGGRPVFSNSEFRKYLSFLEPPCRQTN